MTATLRWNRLEIEADGDAAFKKDVSSHLAKLMATPHARVEVDLGACDNIGEDGFKQIGPMLVDAAGRKQLVVRVNRNLARYFEGSGLCGLFEVNVIERMDGAVKPMSEDDEPPSADELTEDTVPPEDDSQSTRIQTRSKVGSLRDEEDGREYPVGDEIVIGREPPSNPAFAIPTISKRHFRIFRQGPGYFIEDLRSTNGTYLNGNPLTQPQPLADGDEIVVAITLKHPEGARHFRFGLVR